MMLSEFYQSGAHEVDEKTYSIIEDVWTAYDRFITKGQMASFWNARGERGIMALKEPLDCYRALKREKEDLQERVDALLKQVQDLKSRQQVLDDKMEAITLQCGLSSHWAKWA